MGNRKTDGGTEKVGWETMEDHGRPWIVVFGAVLGMEGFRSLSLFRARATSGPPVLFQSSPDFAWPFRPM